MVVKVKKIIDTVQEPLEWYDFITPEDPIPGLEPVGGGFYATSGDPVSPYDCERWPDSPYCGGFPFTPEPIGFDFSWVVDECNIGIQVNPSFGFVRLPASQLVYRFPGKCRLPPPPLPPIVESVPECPPLRIIGSPSEEALAIAFVHSYTSYRELVIGDGGRGHWEMATQNTSIVRLEFRTGGKYATVTFATAWHYTNTFYEIDRGGTSYSQYEIRSDYPRIKREQIRSNWTDGDIEFAGAIGIEFTNSLIKEVETDGFFTACEEFRETVHWDVYDFIVNGNPPTIYYDTPIRSFSVDPYTSAGTFYGLQWLYQWEDLQIVNRQSTVQIFQNDYYSPPPPPPPPPNDRKCKCMCCDDSLMKLLLKRINTVSKIVGETQKTVKEVKTKTEETSKAIGIEDYPVDVPQWINKDNSPQIQIENVTRFISYTIKQLDAISGNYPIKVKIEDSNLTQEGDQEKIVTIPNAAEGIAEMLGLLLAIRSETSATLAAAVNSMIEAGSAKQSAIIAQQYAQANAEFLGYKGEQKAIQIPFAFRPNEPQLEKMFRPTTVWVKGWDNTDKQDLSDIIAPILEMAAMYKAQNFRKLGAGSPIDKLREILKGASDIPNSMAEFRKYPPQDSATEPEEKKDEWDIFIDQAEEGFISQPGITDNKNPYGRPREQRPRVREIGTDTSDIDEGEGEE